MADESRVNTPENPFGAMQVLRWEPHGTEAPSNAVAAPPATSVAGETVQEAAQDPDISEASPEVPEGEEGTGATDERQPSRRPIAPRISELVQQRDAEKEARAVAEGRATALQAELDYWKSQATQGQQGREAPQTAPQAPQDGLARDAQGIPQYPMEANYATQADYHQAVQAYMSAMIQMGVQVGLQQHQQRTAFETALAEARAKKPNLDQLMAVRVPMNRALEQAVADSPQWPLVMAYLAEHPAEAQQLTRVDRRGAYLAVVDIEQKLSGALSVPSPVPSVPQEPSIVSSTPPPPPPVPPVRGRSVAAPQGYESGNYDYMDFFRQRNKEQWERQRQGL